MRRARGFTLIEVLVAFVLLTLVFSSGFEVFSQGMRRAADLEDQSKALSIVQSKLALAGSEEALKEGRTEGDADDRRFHWILAITPMQEASMSERQVVAPYILYRIESTVRWSGADGREHSQTLATASLGLKP